MAANGPSPALTLQRPDGTRFARACRVARVNRAIPTLILSLALTGLVLAERAFSGGYWGESYVPDEACNAREVESHSTGTPKWTNPAGFEKDVFAFARVKRSRAPYSRGGPWTIDASDSDLNLSYRLQQMTSMKVDPNGRFLWLTDKILPEHPFLYMVEPGSLQLSDAEVVALRNYLLNGGFLMLDDFWGEEEWATMERELKKVFPDRAFIELPLDHPVYHCVFRITSKGQVPNVGLGSASEHHGITWERPDAQEVHHRAIFDAKGRMMVFAAHNTDNGDGWEREGEHEFYFRQFSEKIAYPLGINVIFYALTH